MILDVQFKEQEAVLNIDVDKVVPNPCAVVYHKEQDLTEAQKARVRSNIGVTYFGTPYSNAEQIIDISASGDGSVNLYLFPTAYGYDAVVSGNGSIADYTDDNRPYDAQKIHRLHIEQGITSAGAYFMYKAYNLQKLTFADSTKITHIGNRAFAHTQIDGEYDFSGLTDTSLDGQFRMCPKLKGLTFNSTIAEITEKSFQFCLGLEYVNGLTSVRIIGDAAFQYCTSMATVDITPENITLGNWVFLFVPTDAKAGDAVLANASWASQGSLCFVQNDWTAEQIAAIRAVTGESVEMPIPESDNQSTAFYKQWGAFVEVDGGEYKGMTHPASGCCGIFSLLHIYNILNPNTQYDTFYDFITKCIEPRKIEVTQSLHNALASCEIGQALIAGNTAVSYNVGSEITARDLPAALDDAPCHTWGDEGTSSWGVCKALGWTGTRMLFEGGEQSGAKVKQAVLDSLAVGKPVMMEIVGAADTGYGMHAVVAIGYDAGTDRLLILDSTWSYPSNIVPLVFWSKFESLIAPNEASAIWTFDFGEVVTMTNIDSKLNILMESVNSGFHTESGTVVLAEDLLPDPSVGYISYELPCSAGSKMVAIYADSETMTAIRASQYPYFASLMSNNFAEGIIDGSGKRTGLFMSMFDGGDGWELTAGTVRPSNKNGFKFNSFGMKAGTYHWTAYYWNE